MIPTQLSMAEWNYIQNIIHHSSPYARKTTIHLFSGWVCTITPEKTTLIDPSGNERILIT